MTTTTMNNVSTFTTKEQVLAALAGGQCTVDAASAWLKAHESNGHSNGISLKVSEKGLSPSVASRGSLSLSDPVAVAFEELFANKDKIEAFIRANNGKLSAVVRLTVRPVSTSAGRAC